MNRSAVAYWARSLDDTARLFRVHLTGGILSSTVQGIDHSVTIEKALLLVTDAGAEAEVSCSARDLTRTLRVIAYWWQIGSGWSIEGRMVVIPVPQQLRAGFAGDVDPVVVLGVQAMVEFRIPVAAFEEAIANAFAE